MPVDRFKIFSLLILLLTSATFARVLDWPEVAVLANRQSPEKLRIEREHQTAWISSTLARRTYWPRIETSAELPSRSESLREELFYNQSDSSYLYQWVRDRSRGTTMSATVSQPLPLGIQVNASANEWKRVYAIGGDPETSEYGSSYTADVRWKILETDATRTQFQNAGIQRRELLYRKVIRERDYELNLLADYIALFNADGQRKLAKVDAVLADSSRALAQRKFSAGVIPQTDLLVIELSALERNQSAEMAERNWQNVKDRFLQKIGLPQTESIELPEEPLLPTVDTTRISEISATKLPEAKIAKAAYEQSKRTTQASRFPLPLRAEARVFQDWDGRGTNRRAAVDKLSESKGGTFSLNLTLLDRNEFALRWQRTTLELREVEATYREALLDVDRTVREAQRQWVGAQNRLVTAQKLLQLTKLRADMTAGRFAAGTVQSRDLLESQQDRLRAEQNLLSARGEWLIAALRLQRMKEQCELN